MRGEKWRGPKGRCFGLFGVWDKGGNVYMGWKGGNPRLRRSPWK